MESLDVQAKRENLELWVHLQRKVRKVTEVVMEKLARLVHVDQWDLQDLMDAMEIKDLLAFLVNLDLMVPKENMAVWVHQDSWDPQVYQALQVFREAKEKRVTKVTQN